MDKEEQFHDEMIRLCAETTGAVYNPGYFRNMVYQSGGLAAAKTLLNAPNVSNGFRFVCTLTLGFIRIYAVRFA